MRSQLASGEHVPAGFELACRFAINDRETASHFRAARQNRQLIPGED
jgi:hypothetical protein